MYLPVVLSFFLICNVLIHFFKVLRKSTLKIFSMWLYFVIIIVIQNSQKLIVYATVHFGNFFSLAYFVKWIHLFALFAVFVITFSIWSLIPMLFYSYHDKAILFLSNLKLSSISLVFMKIKFIIKPFCESLIHIFMFYSPGIQKLILITSSTIWLGTLVLL